MRRAITAFFRFCLRIFFRRIEIGGLERIPDQGAVIFAVNHPNGLVDPLFVLCFAPRPVSFLGKAPLFHYFFIGWFVRLFDTIPVYRKQDNTTGTNQETFTRARAVLRGGGSIAIFPEGTTHDDPQLRALKTGAARIALGAAMDEIAIVPTGIYYTAKNVFRSSAMVSFGEPIRVGGRASRPPAPGILPGAEPPDETSGGSGRDARPPDEPPPEDVLRLTEAIDAGLDAVTVQADSHAALELIARAEDIFSADEDQPLAEELELRRRFIDGYHYLRTHDPARLEKLQSAVTQFVSELRRANLDVHELKPRIDVGRLFRVLVLLPIAVIGAILNYPAYRLVRILATRFAKGEGAVMATMKVLAALVLYPLTYIVVAMIVGWRFGWAIGVIAGLVLPVIAYIALVVFEDMDDIIGDVRALAHRLFRRYGYEALLAKRHAILEEFLSVAREMGRFAIVIVAFLLAACSHLPPPEMKKNPPPVTIGNGGRTATFHYLGAGGWMIRRGDDAVLLAPFFSNPGMIHLALGAGSNRPIVRREMKRVENDLPHVRAVLAGHAHYDHIMDLPTALENVPEGVPLLGGATVCNTLALKRPCIDMTENAGTRNDAATPYPVPGIAIRPYFSEHSAHFLKVKLFNGHYPEPLPHVPSHGFRWREGETLAYLIDFLDGDKNPELRIWYVDASPSVPYGVPDPKTLEGRPVDIAIFCVGAYAQQENYPKAYLDILQPRHSLLGHWESFFRRASLPSRTLPATNVPKFLERMKPWPYTLPERHTVIVVNF